jgi:integrase
MLWRSGRDIGPRNKASSVYQLGRVVDPDLLPAWRGRSIDTITQRDVVAVLDGIADRGAVIKARRVYANLKRMFKWCMARGFITDDPMKGLEKPGKEKSRERTLTDKELAAVWRAVDGGPFDSIVKLLILTGARREEIGQLKWSEIDGDTIRLEGTRTKNGGPHLIPLSKPALDLLKSLPRIVGEYLF